MFKEDRTERKEDKRCFISSKGLVLGTEDVIRCIQTAEFRLNQKKENGFRKELHKKVQLFQG